MPRRPSQPRQRAQQILAWLALLVILVWLAASWPRAAREKTRRVSEETSATPRSGASTEPAAGAQGSAEIVTELLNFRSKPDRDNKAVIGSLKRGMIVEVLEKQPDWLHVKLDDGRTGYVVYKPELVKFIE